MESKKEGVTFSVRMSPNDMRLLNSVTKGMGNPSKGSALKMLLHLKAEEMGIDTGENEAAMGEPAQ